MRRRTAVFGVVLGLVVVTITTADAGLPIEKVVGGPGIQYWPSANPTHVAWTDFGRGPGNVKVNVMDLATESRMRVNEGGTGGLMGSFIAGTDELIYQQYSRARSDLYFYDVLTQERRKAPRAVNAPGWEYWPMGSTDFLLFMRATNDSGNDALYLFDRGSGRTRRLDKERVKQSIYPGFIGSGFAAWTHCTSRTCRISVYDISARSIVRAPHLRTKAYYAPTIDEASGQLYFVQSQVDRCGRAASIRRAPLGSTTSSNLVTLPRTVDTGWTLSLAPNTDTGFQDLYFERYDCDRGTGDVYVTRSVDVP